MKFLVLLFIFVAVTMVADARPSIEKDEQLKEALKMDNKAEKTKRHLGFGRTQYQGWDTSVNTAHAAATAHIQTGHNHFHHVPHLLPHFSTSHSEAHSISANVNLPHSSLSIAHSEAHQQTLG